MTCAAASPLYRVELLFLTKMREDDLNADSIMILPVYSGRRDSEN